MDVTPACADLARRIAGFREAVARCEAILREHQGLLHACQRSDTLEAFGRSLEIADQMAGNSLRLFPIAYRLLDELVRYGQRLDETTTRLAEVAAERDLLAARLEVMPLPTRH